MVEPVNKLYAELQEEIKHLARVRNAVILAHNYERAEVQDVADFVGDSLGLSREAAKTVTPGSYAYLPAKHPHEFTCVTACSLFVAADNVFDIHYVDKDGKEISLADAQKFGKGAAKAPVKK